MACLISDEVLKKLIQTQKHELRVCQNNQTKYMAFDLFQGNKHASISLLKEKYPQINLY